MRAGKLDKRITLRRATVTKDAYNADTETWVDLASGISASVHFVSDAERYRAGEVGATQMVRFEIRYSSLTASVDPRDRVLYRGREYDISGVKELGRNNRLEITASARAETPA